MSTSSAERSETPSRRSSWSGLLVGFVAGFLIGGCTNAGLLVRKAWERVHATRLPQRVGQARSEIDQIGVAIVAFKTRFDLDHIPDGIVLEGDYTDDGSDLPSASYLKRMFPDLDLGATGLPDRRLDCNQTLVFFLSGGPVTKYDGFSLVKNRRFDIESRDSRIGPFLLFHADRFDSEGRFLDPWGTPYVYFVSTPVEWTYRGQFHWSGWSVKPYRRDGQFVEPKGHQVISAGPNRQFGPGGNWLPGQGPWADDGPGGDDLSNFSATTLFRSDN